MWGNSLGMGTLTGCVADCVADRVADCVADRVADRVAHCVPDRVRVQMTRSCLPAHRCLTAGSVATHRLYPGTHSILQAAL